MCQRADWLVQEQERVLAGHLDTDVLQVTVVDVVLALALSLLTLEL